MIRQRIDRHGRIFPLAPESELPACNMSPEEIGMIKPGPVRKWIGTKKVWDSKYSNQKRSVQKKRAEGIAIGYEKFGDDIPPPSALAGRRLIGVEVKPDKPSKKSWGMAMWSGWGSKHDELTMNREENADKAGRGVTTTTASAGDGAGARDYHDINEVSENTDSTDNLFSVSNSTECRPAIKYILISDIILNDTKTLIAGRHRVLLDPLKPSSTLD